VLNVNSFEPARSFNSCTGSGPRVQNFRQPGYCDFDIGLEKSVQITERLKFQLRGDAFNIFNQHLWLPKTPSELKTQRFRAFMRSLCDYDELSFRRPSRFCRLQFSNPCRPAGGDPHASSPTRSFPKERAAALAPPGLRPVLVGLALAMVARKNLDAILKHSGMSNDIADHRPSITIDFGDNFRGIPFGVDHTKFVKPTKPSWVENPELPTIEAEIVSTDSTPEQVKPVSEQKETDQLAAQRYLEKHGDEYPGWKRTSWWVTRPNLTRISDP
jgi:hypothetical protein